MATTKDEILDAIASVDDDGEIVFEDEDGNRFELLDSGFKEGKHFIYLKPADER